MSWKRARRPEQIEQRRAAILESSTQLFEKHGFDGVSLNAIARQSKIAKSNVYRYFESKEVIFLHILYNDELEWAADLERKLAGYVASNKLEAVADVLAKSIAERLRLSALMAVMASVLEKNVTEDSVLWFKTSIHKVMSRIAGAIHAAVPKLSADQASLLLRCVIVFVSGLWPIAHPPPVVAKVLKRPEFKYAKPEFDRDLAPIIVFLLKGMIG